MKAEELAQKAADVLRAQSRAANLQLPGAREASLLQGRGEVHVYIYKNEETENALRMPPKEWY